MPRPARRIGHEADPLAQLGAVIGSIGVRISSGRTRDVGERLVAEQPRQLAHDLAELLRLGVLVAQDRQLVEDGRVARDVEVRGGHEAPPGGGSDGGRVACIVATRRVPRRRGILGPCPTSATRPSPAVTAPASPASDAERAARAVGPRARSAAPILVRQVRNGIEESVHRGDIVEADADGRLIRVLGDPDRLVTLRSTVKPFGAVALIEAGGIDAFDLEPRRDRDHGQLAFRRGPPRPDAPGHLPAGRASARRSSPAAPRACRSTR